MPIDWKSVATVLGGIAKEVGVKAVDRAIDSALEDVDRAAAEVRKRVKKARSRIPKPEPVPDDEVIDGTIEED